LSISTSVFIHRSIKTRIETGTLDTSQIGGIKFLYIDPLKQGLKLKIALLQAILWQSFYT